MYRHSRTSFTLSRSNHLPSNKSSSSTVLPAGSTAIAQIPDVEAAVDDLENLSDASFRSSKVDMVGQVAHLPPVVVAPLPHEDLVECEVILPRDFVPQVHLLYAISSP